MKHNAAVEILNRAGIKAKDEYFRNVRRNVNPEWREKARENFEQNILQKKTELEKQRVDLENEEKLLKDEALKSLHGQSQYDRNLLSEMFARNKQQFEECMSEINRYQAELTAADSQMRYLSEQYKFVNDWADKLQYAPDDLKKLIIARFIERITVDRNYRITIYFYISADSFQYEIAEKNGNVVIAMTDEPMVKVVEQTEVE